MGSQKRTFIDHSILKDKLKRAAQKRGDFWSSVHLGKWKEVKRDDKGDESSGQEGDPWHRPRDAQFTSIRHQTLRPTKEMEKLDLNEKE